MSEIETYRAKARAWLESVAPKYSRAARGKLNLTVEEDLALYERLVVSKPLHASPAEHQATPDICHEGAWENADKHGNFRGWIQYRKTLLNEFVPG